MECPKCEGKGFIEFEHGLIMVECDECGGKKEIDDSEPESLSDVAAEANAYANALMPRLEGEKRDDNSSRTGQPDNSTGSADTSKPKHPKKPRAKKKARKRTRKILQ